MPRYDFPAISDGEKRDGPPPDMEPGATVQLDETLYEDTGGDWKNGEWGEEIGTVTLKHSRATRGGPILVLARFAFGDDETVEYEGPVPGQGTWRGRGRLGFRGGTGKFATRGGEIDVESTNPKRWG